MNKEKEISDQTEHKSPIESEKKVHQTHFPVLEIQLQNRDLNSGYEWVHLDNGRWKLVRKER